MVREYRYAMYNRPVWGSLSLSQPYTLDFDLTHPDVVENRKYYNRDAHSILATTQPLTADEIRNLEMVDIAADNKQRAHKAKLIEYVNALAGVSDSGKRVLIPMVEIGKYIKNKADVDRYADKFMSQGTRSARKQTTEKPPGKRFETRPQILLHGIKGGEPIYANFATSTDVSYKGKMYREKYRYRYGSLLSARDELVRMSATDVHSILIDFGEAEGISRYAVFCTTPRTYAPAATKKPAPTPSVPPILTAPPELAADVLGGLTPTQAELTRARELGKAGYWAGKQAPAQDAKILDMCRQRSHDAMMALMTAWTKGWDAEHQIEVDKELLGKGIIMPGMEAATPKARKPKKTIAKPAPTPSVPPILTAPPELAADVLSGLTPTPAAKPKKQPAKRKPAPNLPPALTTPPELAADMLGTGPTQAAPGRKPAVKDRVKMHDGEWAHITEVRTDDVRVKPDGLSHIQVLIYTDMLHKVAYRPDPIANMSFYWQVRARKTAAAPKRKPAAKPAAKPKKQPAPDIPPILTAPPELAADVLGTGPMGLTPTPAAQKRKPAARTTKKQPKKTTAAKTRKTTKKPAKPKTKKTAATPKLTASQQEYLTIQGFVMVKRGGKYVKITN